MNILIVFDSESGNTKKVVNEVKTNLVSNNHSVTVKHALTCKKENIRKADLLIIGTPIHGWILVNQRPTKSIREFIKNEIPTDLNQLPVLGFCTYLFFPAGGMKSIKSKIESSNGKIVSILSGRRTNKPKLVSTIVNKALQVH